MNKIQKLEAKIGRLEDQLRIFELRAFSGADWIEHYAKNQKESADWLRSLAKRVLDCSLCNDPCKWMYYCEKKKNHAGRHNDRGLEW